MLFGRATAGAQLLGFLTGEVVDLIMWLPMLAFEVTLGVWLIVKGVAIPIPAVATDARGERSHPDAKEKRAMHPTDKAARVAGAIYLSLGLTAPIRLIYIPSTLFVRGNATATSNNIAAHELLFRLGIVSDLLTGTIAIFLVLALYRLFRGVDQNHATLMVILGGLMVAPIYFLNALNDVAALLLVRGADFLSAFGKPQRDALAMLFLRLHQHGVVANEIFWGLWLFPLAVLVLRSGFLPRFLGVWLIINGFAYLTISFTGLLLPQYEDVVSRVAFPALLGEMAVLLWLLIKGARVRPLAAATPDRSVPA
jgi:hypothetical protein